MSLLITVKMVYKHQWFYISYFFPRQIWTQWGSGKFVRALLEIKALQLAAKLQFLWSGPHGECWLALWLSLSDCVSPAASVCSMHSSHGAHFVLFMVRVRNAMFPEQHFGAELTLAQAADLSSMCWSLQHPSLLVWFFFVFFPAINMLLLEWMVLL